VSVTNPSAAGTDGREVPGEIATEPPDPVIVGARVSLGDAPVAFEGQAQPQRLRRRIETRFLVRDDTLAGLYGVTFRWDAAQTNAMLVPEEGASETLVVWDNGVVRKNIKMGEVELSY